MRTAAHPFQFATAAYITRILNQKQVAQSLAVSNSAACSPQKEPQSNALLRTTLRYPLLRCLYRPPWPRAVARVIGTIKKTRTEWSA